MIIKTELVKRIKEYFNLNIYETKVWLALLSKGIASAKEVADLSGVPRSRTYDVLESLEKRGFAITKIGKPVKYISVKPTEVIEKMKSETLQDASERVKLLGNLKETQEYVELQSIHNAGISPIKSADITGSIKGRNNLLSKIRELVENVENELIICTSVADFEDKARVLIPSIEKLTNNDIKVKVMLSGDHERVKKTFAKLNIKPMASNTPARFFIADKEEAVFLLTPENSDEDLAVWLNSSFFSESLATLLNQYNSFSAKAK
jgi:HTH-type transcriptional regulator, sugar sensing transcriptional regulator